MSGHRWYRRCGHDFVLGTMMLSLEEKGAYSLCLDLIYDRGAPIPDDARWLAGVCGVSLRKWGAIRQRLVDLGKLYVVEGGAGEALLSNVRADFEIASSGLSSQERSESGAKGGRNRAENERHSRENKDLGEAQPKHKREDKKRGESRSTDRQRAGARGAGEKGSRIAEGWRPEKPYPADVQAIVESWPPEVLERRIAEFVNYWLSRGRDAAKRDWDRTWWNRVYSVAEHIAARRAGEAPVAEASVDGIEFGKAGEPGPIEQLRRKLADGVGANTYKRWIDPLIFTVAAVDGVECLTIIAPTSVTGEYVRNNLGAHVERLARRALGDGVEVRWLAGAGQRKAA